MSKDSLMAAVAQAAGADDAKPVVVTADLIKTHFPSVAADLMAAGRAEGAKAERERVAGIEAALIPGHEKIIAEMKADPTKTELDAHRAVAAAERQARADVRSGLDKDEAEMKGLRSEHGPANGKDEPKKPAATAQTPDGWKAEYAASEELQAEFATEAAYLAFKQAEKAGRVRIKRAA